MRVDSSDNVFAIAGTKTAAVKLSSTGSETWKTGQLDSGAQMNDIELASDGVVVVGHKYSTTKSTGCGGDTCGVIKGHMKKLSATGTVEWSQDYGNYGGGVNQFDGLSPGDWALVYNECWGVAPTYTNKVQDGYAMACGTGIEGCDLYKGDLLTTCKADPRTTWRSLTIATDLKGERVYHRMDSFQSGESTVWASAAEYIFASSGDTHTIVTDEAMGFGFMTLAKYDGNVCTTAKYPDPPKKTDVETTEEGDNEEGDGGFWDLLFGGSSGASTIKYSAAASMAAILLGNAL